MSGITILLALLVLGFLVFIHELGHYIMARRAGMRVDVFSIGFGPTLARWTWQDVEWKLCLLPFGGYVKIAGMYDDEGGDPRKIRDGYYAASPIKRILVAFAGPFVNLMFAILAFTMIWSLGGREKPFSQYTHRIGWVDPNSELYAKGVRPGDIVTHYEGRAIKNSRDHILQPMISDPEVEIKGFHVNPVTQAKTEFKYKVTRYALPGMMEDGILTAGVTGAASYIIYYDTLVSGTKNPLADTSPLKGSGLESGDRIFWVDGEPIYSNDQLSHVLNDGKALLTIEREGQTQLVRAPRTRLLEFSLTREQREELTDWQFAADLRKTDFKDLQHIPYNLTTDCVVEGPLEFLDKADQKAAFPEQTLSDIEKPLKAGDRIVAIDGTPVKHSHDMLALLQTHKVHVIVERGKDYRIAVPIEEADESFNGLVRWREIDTLAATIGTPQQRASAGRFVLLKPIVPVTGRTILANEQEREKYDKMIKDQEILIKQQLTGDKLQRALTALQASQDHLYLGVPGVQDRIITYNPPPLTAFWNLLTETFDTLRALVSGYLSPKFLAGPVGIVHVIQQQVQVGWMDVLFLMAFISQQLGILNLMPIPILDGGHICFAIFEMVSGRQLKQKTMERMTVPFYFLLIGLAIFLTYHDILRVVRTVFGGF